ncbi:mannose-1-phosphate guanylyltransferase [Desulfacinum infernum DSM 9756]|uniref:Mannose-1-phosphate guanylyltransferase n=1 Tax=Desulfacinum infernum DSM 9756 TaxID=1121391 RepID=A0A1M5B0B1_9BACT|nr:NDP-sugar synthase [Desulfacinum infernum]SHF35893.1 mannose-1-phosphate guanylyltransferase [Desulfacinum infernum DSM 9756]
MKAMILAAGYGERLRPLTDVRPKPLCPVVNVPLLDYWIRRLADEGVSEIVINAHHLADQLEAHLARSRWPVRVHLLRERKILGTGGGLRNALSVLDDGPFLAVNADIACDVSVKELFRVHQDSGAPATLLLCRSERFDSVRVNTAGNRIEEFERPARHSGSHLHVAGTRLWTFTGVHVIEPRILRNLPKGVPHHIIDLYEELICQNNPPAAWCVPDLWWREIGSPDAYWALNRECASNPKKLLPQGGNDHGPVFVHPDARVDPDARFQGMVVVGAGCRIAKDAFLEDVILWENVRVAPGVSLRGCIVTDGVRVETDHRNEILLADGRVMKRPS